MKCETPDCRSQPLYQAAVVVRLAKNRYLTSAAPAKASMLNVTTPLATISHPLKPQSKALFIIGYSVAYLSLGKAIRRLFSIRLYR
jgi:hypothetical protein